MVMGRMSGSSVPGSTIMKVPERFPVTSQALEGDTSESYILHLGEEYCWNLSSAKGAREWLSRFAKIVGLKTGRKSGLTTLRFIRGIFAAVIGGEIRWPSDRGTLASLEEEGWRLRQRSFLNIWSRVGTTDLVLELLNTPFDYIEITMMRQALQPVYERVIAAGGVPIHAALVEHGGVGMLLAGVGGSGKTTCCERLPSGWTYLGDDEVLVVRKADGALAPHPMPTWNSERLKNGADSWDISVSVPLGGIFFLEKSSRDEAVLLGGGEAAVRINGSVNQACRGRFHSLDASGQREWRQRLFENACGIARNVPAYQLYVSRTGQFWTVIEEAMLRMRARK